MVLKGKEWFKIVAPKLFNEVVIGETPVIEAQLLKGRVVEASMIELSNDPTKYYTKFFFKINELNGNNAKTIFWGHDTTRDYIARIVTRGSSRIDANQVVQLKDGKLRVKAIAVTVSKAPSKIKNKLHVAFREELKKLNNYTVDEFIKNILSGKLQAETRDILHKMI